MPPRKKRKSLNKISAVKLASTVIPKQNKKKGKYKRSKNNNLHKKNIMNETFVRLSGGEENNSEDNKATKALDNMEVVGDENILSADFIPFSSGPMQRCVPKVNDDGDDDETSKTLEISEIPVTIVDDDTESICVDDSISSSHSESDSVNDSIQIVGETEKSCRKLSLNDSIQIVGETEKSCKKLSDQVSPNSFKRKFPLSAAKKRKIDDSIEILEMIDLVSSRPGKKAKIDKKLENSSASLSLKSNSGDETPGCLDEDDDIVIVETVDNNSRDGIQIMNDFIPLKMSSALIREKNRRRKNFVKKNRNRQNISREDQNTSATPSIVFQDTIGIVPGSAHYKSPLSKNANEDLDTNVSYHNVYGNNVYNPNSVQKTGLRPVIIDGSNVAFGHGGKSFSTRGIEICVNYFVKRGHWVVAFVPLFRRSEVSDADRQILDDLKKNNQLAFTPSRFLHGRRVSSYDDRFIVQCAAELGGIVVSTDNYRDLVCENEAWRETIEKRLLMFTWVGDLLMFPDDPNGRGGPRLEEFLRFPQ